MLDNELFIPTLNKQGYAAPKLDPFSQKFTEYAEGEFLEVGAAFGFASLAALENGASVTANDLDERHLQHIKDEAKQKSLTKLTTVAGSFPNELPFAENQFSKILVSRVLHFFSGVEFKQALEQLKSWLIPDGELIIVCETPFLTNWQSFIPEFNKRIEQGEAYPGEIDNPKYWEKNWSDNLPDFVHWLDQSTLERLVTEAGFSIVDSAYINRQGMFPESLLLDGRESVGIIAKK